MNKINWTLVVVIAVVLLLAVSMFGGWGYGGQGRMGPGMMGGWGFSPFGWIGMIFMWLIPLGFIVLTILGIVWLVKAIGSRNQPASSGQHCPSCGRSVQPDWGNCPYCGTQLVK